jgi:serine/threonine-protein kinase
MRGVETLTQHELGNALVGVSVVDVVDLLLLALAQRAGSITVTPSKDAHSIEYEHAGVRVPFATVHSSLGDAIAARLALLAGLGVGVSGVQVGRVRVRPKGAGLDVAPTVTELLVAVHASREGLGAEAHRISPSAVAEVEPSITPEDLARGRARVGMYQIMGELGQGGMGVVYRAEHVALQKQVALKVLHPEVALVPTVAAQFLVEARAACRARHPGIVDVTDFGTLAGGRSYFVMELVTAPTLAKTLDHDGPLPLRRAITIARNIAEGLAAAAAQGVVHRDLTPANVFLFDDDTTKIGDFGLARIVDPKSPSPARESIAGTAGYMSPEQGLGEPTDTRGDIYSLGVILFRMITGKVPFSGRTLVEILQRHMSDPVPRMEGVDGPAPDAVQHLVARAMAKSPIERYQTVDEMLLALREIERTLSRDGWRRLLRS